MTRIKRKSEANVMKPDIYSLPAHPVAELFPMMTDAELDDLAKDIGENGLKCPIVVDHEGELVLDGRNRRDACKRAGVEPSIEFLPERHDPVRFIVSLNLKRRHLDETRRGMIAARIANLPHGVKKDDASIEASVSQPDAATLLNVSRTTVQRARKVISRGAPQLIEAVNRGEIRLGEAARIAELPKTEQRKIVGQPKGVRKLVVAATAPKDEQPPLPFAPTESTPRSDPVDLLMVQVKELSLPDFGRFKARFRAYCGELPPEASVASPSDNLPACQSPKGSCRYTSCATEGRCLVNAAA